MSDPGRNAPSDLAEALGRLMISFSSLEESLHDGIWEVVGLTTPEVRLLTTGMNFQRLVEKFELVYEERAKRQQGLQPVAKLCDLLQKLRVERNDMIHGMWQFDSDTGKVHRYTVKGSNKRLKFNMQAVRTESITDLTRRVEAAEDKLWEIILDLEPAA